ncbi:hypothetical protein [Streptomyces yatensis]|uniref:Integral membrane protein n=1 Tax=Streptomyces yatensis TaxID=155177 RepID=A0ABP4UDE8_9ACTN|nr:hypothetical protein [Streptomyces yatensis]
MTGSPDEDNWPEPAPAQRPGQLTAAAVLLVVSAFIGTTIAVNDPELTQFVYLLLFVTIGAAIRIRKGGRAARVTASVTAALLFLYLGPHAIRGLSDPGGVYQPDYAVRAIIAIVGSGTGVGLLYSAPSRAYVRPRRHRTAR